MYYIFGENKNCIGTIDSKPNQEDLLTRGEIAVFSEKIYSDVLKLIYKDGEIVELQATLDELKAAKIAELKAERDAKEVEPIEYNESSFDYDDKARDRINAAIIALDLQGADATLEWTTADNTNVTVTATDLKMVIAAVAVRSNALHVAYRAAKTEVQAAQTKEELEAIVLE